jgi:hypothetical protein
MMSACKELLVKGMRSRIVKEMMLQQPPVDFVQHPVCKLARASFHCGLAGFFLGLLTGIPAIVMGHRARARIKKSGGTPEDLAYARCGLILGYFNTFFLSALVGYAILGGMRGRNLFLTTQTFHNAARIEAAVDSFFLDYGSFPVSGSVDTTLDFLHDASKFDVLLGSPAGATVSPSIPLYLSLKIAKGGKGGMVYDASGTKIKGIFDSWGNPYRIRMDFDLDGAITVNGTVVHGKNVVVWSDGPDGAPGTPDDIGTW